MIMVNTTSILVVEDQPNERETLTRFLRAENYEVHSVPHAMEAIECVNKTFDLVLSDVRLGSASGVDLLKAWKRTRPQTPFILMTAFGDIETAVEAVKAGAEDYLVKPVSPRELLDKISNCLETARHRAAGGNGNGSHQGASHAAANVKLEDIERAAIERALEECRGNRTHAAQALGISVRTLQRKLKAWSAAAAETASA
jgi:DNA-binding NtrC family response regulator